MMRAHLVNCLDKNEMIGTPAGNCKVDPNISSNCLLFVHRMCKYLQINVSSISYMHLIGVTEHLNKM